MRGIVHLVADRRSPKRRKRINFRHVCTVIFKLAAGLAGNEELPESLATANSASQAAIRRSK